MAIICHCEVVRERTIVKAVQRGARTVAEVQVSCGAATRCGGCEPAVQSLIERHGATGHAVGDVPVGVRATLGLSV